MFTTKSLEATNYAQNTGGKIRSHNSFFTHQCKHGCKMKGLPDLMRSKGYNVHFSTCGNKDDMSYDDWRQFLTSVGGYSDEELWDPRYHKEIARKARIQRNSTMTAPFKWGEHDGFTFSTLGAQIKNLHAKNKTFFIQHYAISSHIPWKSRPLGFKTPHFHESQYRFSSKLYLEMMYYTDYHLGLMINDLKRSSSVLDNTILLIMGDHGPPLPYLKNKDTDQSWMLVSDLYTHIPIILLANKHLGPLKGAKFNKSVSQVDVLNTLADMLGVPAGGFVQHGIGRSLLRRTSPEQEVSYFRHIDKCVAQYNNFRIACSCSELNTPCRVYDVIADPDMRAETTREAVSNVKGFLEEIERKTRLNQILSDDMMEKLIAEANG
jgi:phosphoglycerol transferase MdoB-like AlkP superfamily enzyme